MISVEVTALFAAILALVQIFFTFRVIVYRRANKISLGDGADSDLQKRRRAHANFTETVPIALILLLLNELSGADLWRLYVLGTLLLVSRALHYVGIVKTIFRLRVIGMAGTILMIISSAISLFV